MSVSHRNRFAGLSRHDAAEGAQNVVRSQVPPCASSLAHPTGCRAEAEVLGLAPLPMLVTDFVPILYPSLMIWADLALPQMA